MSADYSGSSGLTSTILGAVSQAGASVASSYASQSLSVAPSAAPQRISVVPMTKTSGMNWLIVIVVLFVGFFAYREL